MTTNPLTIAADTLRSEGVITDYNTFADDCGEPTLLRIEFGDGTFIVAGIESDDDGEPEGYTWTAYEHVADGDDSALNAGGGTDWDKFAADVRAFAAGTL